MFSQAAATRPNQKSQRPLGRWLFLARLKPTTRMLKANAPKALIFPKVISIPKGSIKSGQFSDRARQHQAANVA
jgi:hypothetical protein